MTFVPMRPYDTESRAEKNLFYKLLEKLYQLPNCHVFHSYNVHNHPYKVTGEADFLVLCKFGVFALEVKGGGISVEEGQWYSTNKDGKHSISDPFKQASSAVFAVRKDILEQSGFNGLKSKLGVGYGVVFPDTIWQTSYGEYHRQIICDKGSFKSPDKWLVKLFKYWFQRPNQGYELSNEDVRKIKQYLRPNVEYAESLGITLENNAVNQVKLTESQFTLIDAFEAFPRLLCKGGAGTGKTFIAAEMARRLAKSQANILFVCKSPWLAVYLKEIIKIENVTICCIDNLKITVNRCDVDTFDTLIVDEGQDLFNFEDFDKLNAVLKNGIEDGNWYVFHDFDNQTGLVGSTDSEAYALLKLLCIGEPTLKTNCRNTVNILDRIKSCLRVDMGTDGTGIGPDVKEVSVSIDEASSQLSATLEELRQDGVRPELITILSPLPFNQSSISQLPGSLLKRIIRLDEYSIKNPKQNGYGFSEIKHFKGLENEVVVLIDLPNPEKLSAEYDFSNHYVGMSRAKGLLLAIWQY